MNTNNRPAFLDLLADDVILTSTFLKGSIAGRASVIHIIQTVVSYYTSLSRSFHDSLDNREFIEYDAELLGGLALHGMIAMTKNDDGMISRLSVTQSPIESVLWLSTELGKKLSTDYGNDVFL
ncbi:hypothetical protein FHS16_000050 [Paenibacillus endophyticus]|uniref:Nuclear transport factor 2 family protein n=1 Tax=Paenibacillus endophyticus TaxID=1294268 RepID=A0A7W5C2I6_9BACL|nr:hypothetical protein [Paenibacillus endophyticus]MBB3150018.1 hypothetical protein [Paenibacillus endophyticus]